MPGLCREVLGSPDQGDNGGEKDPEVMGKEEPPTLRKGWWQVACPGLGHTDPLPTTQGPGLEQAGRILPGPAGISIQFWCRQGGSVDTTQSIATHSASPHWVGDTAVDSTRTGLLGGFMLGEAEINLINE